MLKRTLTPGAVPHLKGVQFLPSWKYERWLRDEVAPIYDEIKVHPERTLTSEKLFDNIRKRHAARLKGEM